MTRFDRYLLSQLMMLFGFFSLILVLIYWVNRAVVLFDRLIADGQSAGVFFEFTALTLPSIIRLVLPISAFVASIYLANRLSSESELVVARTAGQSPYRMIRPVVIYGVLVALMVGLLTHILVPLSVTRLNERQSEITENVTARLLTEGQFLHPSDGLTFYIKEITPAGELRDVFLSESSVEGEHVTYTARLALLVRQDGGPKLVMFDGIAQTVNAKDKRLSVTRFEDFAIDISSLIGTPDLTKRSARELPTWDLLFPTPAIVEETGTRAAVLMYEGHSRSSQALLAVVAATVGFATLLVGGFSRFGLWRQIIGALVLIIVLKSADNAFADIARSSPANWPFAYGAPILGFAVTVALLWLSDKPTFLRRTGAVS